MDETCNMKIQRLEFHVEQHHERLDQQQATIKEQGSALNRITQILSQLRWMLFGAMGYYIINNVGLLAVITKLFGV